MVREQVRGVARVEPQSPRGAHQRPLLLPLLPSVGPRSAHRGIPPPRRRLTPRRGDWPGWPSPSWPHGRMSNSLLRSRAAAPKRRTWFTLPPHGGLLIGGPGNGAPPPSKSSPYGIIYNLRAEMKHILKVYDAAPLNDHLKELIRAVIFVSINHGFFAKLGPLQGFNFFTSIH